MIFRFCIQGGTSLSSEVIVVTLVNYFEGRCRQLGVHLTYSSLISKNSHSKEGKVNLHL